MKKNKEFNKKLMLNKEAITNLNDIRGGDQGGAAGRTFLSLCRSCIPDNCCPPPDTNCTRQDLSCISCTGDLCNTCDCQACLTFKTLNQDEQEEM